MNRADSFRSSGWSATIATSAAASVLPWLATLALFRFAFGVDFLHPSPDASALSAAGPISSTIATTFVLDVATARVLHRRDLWRSDRWWLAGFLYTINGAVALAAIGLAADPSGVNGLFMTLTVLGLTGHWPLVFAVTALTWRPLAPVYFPDPWTDPEDFDE